MKFMRGGILTGIVFGAMHFAFCMGDLALHLDGDWEGFLIFLLDLPVSPLLMRSHSLPVLVFGGTLWWALLGVIAGQIGKAIWAFVARQFAK